ncbi:MAG TPA: hypothetical protein VNZ45_04825, partial [Bacteroidia bacterium]|nr:hypothetical protein [Bacteroidia bacterium]
KIDGGYEFNGWYLIKWYPARAGKSWWYVDDDEYIVSFAEVDGYACIKRYGYANYLPCGNRNILILHRKE